ERIAEQLRAAGLEVDVQPVKAIRELGYDAVVLGSAVYYGSWMKQAVNFARRNQTILSSRPVWLFSSGPLGTATTDASGQDVREAAVPKEIAELTGGHQTARPSGVPGCPEPCPARPARSAGG